MTTWFNRVLLIAVALSVSATIAACSSATSPTDHRLRVANVGTIAINGLVVRFPGSTMTFGTIPAGTTTNYQPVSTGVYGYGAYEFVVNSVVVRQPVIDWVGEIPLEGVDFTYGIELITSPSGQPMIRLAAVDRDK